MGKDRNKKDVYTLDLPTDYAYIAMYELQGAALFWTISEEGFSDSYV